MLSKSATVKEVETQLRQSALVEMDVARKRQETLSLYLKDKFQEDQKNTAENLQKLNESFKQSMSLTQGSELLEGMRALKHGNEKRLEEMDFIIQNLVGELQEADRHIEDIQRSHLQHIEPLLDQHKRMLMKLEQERESNLHDISSKFSSEKERMLATLQQQNQALVDLLDEPMGISETNKESDDYRWIQSQLGSSAGEPAAAGHGGSEGKKKKKRACRDTPLCSWPSRFHSPPFRR
ncbi:dynein regulatory complex subunit 2 isoform X2 [Cyprinodon tularosa]|uniref:dynein regulatory complex subunit 2 isoform X2 n=1 Tax=Cyprinodon tularosa TaxID=77115 RepID=UPI0018E256CE|nr:dynein regulatory complex subunit 2 isoform X2 [Cyprinodon tularosa]